ncbi:MAG: hypothetical protein NTW72_14160 [Gemmatimonadetes bacterium]|nr:hypothetical protein [Gemmatimonadota bacterium]
MDARGRAGRHANAGDTGRRLLQEIASIQVQQTYYSNALAAAYDTSYQSSATSSCTGKFSPVSLTGTLQPTPSANVSVRMEYDTTGSIGITMRSSFGEFCAPTFYVDGLRMFSLSADELNGMVNVKSVRAIEVYTDATVPMQFQQAMSGCGAIVIWTK